MSREIRVFSIATGGETRRLAVDLGTPMNRHIHVGEGGIFLFQNDGAGDLRLSHIDKQTGAQTEIDRAGDETLVPEASDARYVYGFSGLRERQSVARLEHP